jgi:hypothetical protein
MRSAFNVLRWLLLVPAYVMLMAFCSVWVMQFFTHFPGIWRAHFDVVSFSCSVLEVIALCFLSALIVPSFKKLVGIFAVVAAIGFTLKTWSLVLTSEGLTRPMANQLAADIVGGVLAFIGLVVIHSARQGLFRTVNKRPSS